VQARGLDSRQHLRAPRADRTGSQSTDEGAVRYQLDLDRLGKANDLAGSPRFTYLYDAAGNGTSETNFAGTTTTAYQSGTDRTAQQTGAQPKHYAPRRLAGAGPAK